MKKLWFFLLVAFTVIIIYSNSVVRADNFKENGSVLALSFHQISDNPSSDFTVSNENFRQQMKILKDKGYHSISLEQLDAWINAHAKLPPKPVLITFDDGNRSDYTDAFPILKQVGFTAALFLLSDRVASSDASLSEQLIREMIENHFSIGVHGLSHKSLVGQSRTTLSKETMHSKKQIEKRLKIKCDFFAYPYGNFDEIVENAIKTAGYKGAFTTIPGRNLRKTNPLELRRIVVMGKFTSQNFEKLISGDKELYANLLKGQVTWNIQKGMFRVAEICINELLELDRKKTDKNRNLQIREFSARAYNKMGSILFRLGFIKKARQYFSAAIMLKTDYEEAKKNLKLVSQKKQVDE